MLISSEHWVSIGLVSLLLFLLQGSYHPFTVRGSLEQELGGEEPYLTFHQIIMKSKKQDCLHGLCMAENSLLVVNPIN